MPLVPDIGAPPLIREIAERIPYPCYFVDVLAINPTYPYVLLSDPYTDEMATDPALQRELDTTLSSLFVTFVDISAGNVAAGRDTVRASLGGPWGLTVAVGDDRIRLKRTEVLQSIRMDATATRDSFGRRPWFSVDQYSVNIVRGV